MVYIDASELMYLLRPNFVWFLPSIVVAWNYFIIITLVVLVRLALFLEAARLWQISCWLYYICCKCSIKTIFVWFVIHCYCCFKLPVLLSQIQASFVLFTYSLRLSYIVASNHPNQTEKFSVLQIDSSPWYSYSMLSWFTSVTSVHLLRLCHDHFYALNFPLFFVSSPVQLHRRPVQPGPGAVPESHAAQGEPPNYRFRHTSLGLMRSKFLSHVPVDTE